MFSTVNHSLTHISVCVCTYKRPYLLQRLLSNLAFQETEGLFTYSVVIVDNDYLRSAQEIVEEFAATTEIPIKYCWEARQSIALARNKAVEHSTGDFVAFIDDDEYPSHRWLLLLLKTCEEYGVDGVLGPVHRYFEERPPRWIERSRFYTRPEYLTGYVLTWRQGRTSNLLVKREMLVAEAQPFNPLFRTGEDQDFLERMTNNGRIFIWCNEAMVYEIVPPARWNRVFMLKRALLRGAMEPRTPGFSSRDVVKSVIAVPLYTLALPFALLLGQHRFMDLLVRLCDHLGKLFALVGICLVHEEYVTE